MTMECIVTIDAGTGSGRCVVFDRAGRPLASAQEAFSYPGFNDPTMPLLRGFDLDPPRFWAVLCRSVRSALAALPADARVCGVIAASQREGCVFLDAAGEVLYAGPNLDARAAIEGMEVQQLVDPARLHAITGHAPPYIFPIARWLWFRKHHAAGRVATLLMLNDWITWQLSGARVAEHSNAGESMLYDVSARAWSDELLTAVGLPASALPPLCWAGAAVGQVTAAAAAATGLPAGTPVFAGGADTESALLGAGCHQPGRLGLVLGTTAPVQLVTDRPVLDPGGALWTSSHVVPDQWVLESNGGDTGGTHRWLMELFYGGGSPAAYASVDDELAGIGPDPLAVLAFLGPQVFSLENMNPFRPAGLLFRFPILHVDRPNRAEIMRGFYENVAFAMRGNAEQVIRTSGVTPVAVHASGGMTRSRALVQLIADVLSRPLAVSVVAETASLGSAMLAAVSLGWYPHLAGAVAGMARLDVVDPDPAAFAGLDARYTQWRDGFAAIAGVSV
jgi:autoinducer-2 kinase